MKIKVDERYTSIAQKDAIKEAIKEFKNRYTENDVFQFLKESLEQYGFDGWGYELLTLEMEAFPRSMFDNEMILFVKKCVLQKWDEFVTVEFISFTGNLELVEHDSYFDDKHIHHFKESR